MATTADFSVGDTVKVITTHAKYGWGHINTGDIGIITSINNIFVRIHFPNQNEWMASPDEIMKILIDVNELDILFEDEPMIVDISLRGVGPRKARPKKPDSRHVI